MRMRGLPPGPRNRRSSCSRSGKVVAPLAFLERCRARYGKRFTLRFLDGAAVRDGHRPRRGQAGLHRAARRAAPRRGARRSSSRSSGRNSVILLDEGPHLEQRKLMLPAFHGEKMERLSGLMAEVAEREVASLAARRADRAAPADAGADARDHPARGLRPRPRARLDALRDRLAAMLAFGDRPISLMPPRPGSLAERILGLVGPVAGFARLRAEADELIFELIDERRREEPSATTCSRCCSRRATRTARRWPTRSCATS